MIPAESGLGTGKVKPFGYTYTPRGNPGYRNPSVISVQRCNRMPALADSASVQRCCRMGETQEPPRGWRMGKVVSLPFAAGREGGLVSGWEAKAGR